ncbi:MAG: hypothetical protein ACRERU_07125 [Methylococcales bacterium]
MTAKKSNKLPIKDNVVRYVSWNKLRKDENDEAIGILAEAFKMRDSDKSLSTTWLEYFPGLREDQIHAAVRAIRESKLEVKPKSGFAIGRVGDIQAECAACRYKVRIVHEPEDDNKAQVAVKSLPRDDMELFEQLAIGAWSDWILNKNVPA